MPTDLLKPTTTMESDSPTTRVLHWMLCLLIAAAMVLAASGSGNPDTAEPLPDWINSGSNILCVLIGILVLLPRTRAWGAIAAALMMIVSMTTNFVIDGPGYFVKVLPFNLVVLAISLAVAWHHRGDLHNSSTPDHPRN